MTVDVSPEHWLETYKSLISISIEGFKFSALANGGAAVALLTYLGNVAGKSAPVPDMRYPMAAFLLGLFLVGLAMLFAYFTQLTLLHEIRVERRALLLHGLPFWVAVACFLFSLIAFALGSWQAVVNFG